MFRCQACLADYYESFDAQLYIGISGQTLNRWRREGWIRPSFKVGAGWVYSKKDLDEAMDTTGYSRQNLNVEVSS